MATYLISAALVLLVSCGPPAPAGSQSGRPQSPQTGKSRIDSTDLARIVDSAMAQGMAESIPGAAFILVENGRVILAKGYGQADLAARRAWSPEGTIFPIASITKIFTATAVMQLADRGQIDLNSDVNRYLTSTRVPPTYSQPVTAAHLLSHTAGFDELPGRRVRSITVWGDRWVEVSPLYFVNADGRKRLGFAEDKAGHIVALTGGSWRVLERWSRRAVRR